MASYTAKWAKSATLTSTTVDTITLSGGSYRQLCVLNRGAGTITFTYGENTAGAATPTALGDDMFPVMAGMALTLPTGGGWTAVVVKIIGNADAYSVMGLPV